jgi:hypothetical protein
MTAPLSQHDRWRYETLIRAQQAAGRAFDLRRACSNLRGTVHLKQFALARDRRKRIAACCGRRAGKSTGLMARAVELCVTKAGATVYYCTKSYTWARNTVVEPILKPMLAAAGLVVEEDLQGEIVYTFPNGSKIFFLAADDLGDIKKFNGKKMDLCIVDEMQDLREEVLIEFLMVVVKYCLYDTDGTLILAGIPSEAPVGYWFKIWGNEAYSKHTFTAYDNPLRTREETDAWVEEECREHGISREHPLIQRSVFAVWVPMTDWLVYKYDPLRNGTDCKFFRAVTKDTVGWRFAVGVDTGSMDRTAIVVIGQSQRDPHTHLVDEFVTGHGADLDFTAIVNQLLGYRARYKPTSWYFDPAHAGKPLMAELRNRHGFPLEMSALKAQLKGQVELVNDGLRQGKIKIPPESGVASDMLKTVWDKDEAAKNRWEYSTVHHPDPSEAFRYAYQGVYPSWYKAPDKRTPKQRELDAEMEAIDRRSMPDAERREQWIEADAIDETPEWARNPYAR